MNWRITSGQTLTFSPVVSHSVVEVFVVRGPETVQLSGQEAGLDLGWQGHHPPPIAPHVHLHVWHVCEEHLERTGVIRFSQLEPIRLQQADDTVSNMSSTVVKMTKEIQNLNCSEFAGYSFMLCLFNGIMVNTAWASKQTKVKSVASITLHLIS